MEIPKEQAKITGFVCIGCAVTAVIFAFVGSMFLGVAFNLYFVFLLLSAAFGVAAYSEIEALGNGLVNAIFQLLSIVLLFVSFLSFLSIVGKPRNTTFGIIYGLVAIFLPLTLTVLALITKKIAVWKALVPLAIPFLHGIIFLLITPTSFLFAASLPPFSWALLGIVACGGNRTNRN